MNYLNSWYKINILVKNNENEIVVKNLLFKKILRKVYSSINFMKQVIVIV